MKFDFCIGNPPYQDGRIQVYPLFFEGGKEIASTVELIFPTGWQEPKDTNGLSLLNNENVNKNNLLVLLNIFII